MLPDNDTSAATLLTAPPASSITGVANSQNSSTKVDLQAAYLALVAGLLEDYAPGDVFQILRQTYTRDEVVALIRQFVAVMETTKTSYAQWRGDIQVERAAEETLRPIRAALKSLLVARFGKRSTRVVRYGFRAAKTPVVSVEAKARARAKTQATRAARGTRGSKQNARITGDVTGVVITPVGQDSSK